MEKETSEDQRELLRVFLCHASEDKDRVRPLYRELQSSGVKPWLDEEDLIGGQEWEVEIPKEVRNSDVVLVCVSETFVTKRSYLQKEIRIVLDAAEYQPPQEIFVIPVRLEDCDLPQRLQQWHRIDLFVPTGRDRLLRALQRAAERRGRRLPRGNSTQQAEQEQMTKVVEASSTQAADSIDEFFRLRTPGTRIDVHHLAHALEDIPPDAQDEAVKIVSTPAGIAFRRRLFDTLENAVADVYGHVECERLFRFLSQYPVTAYTYDISDSLSRGERPDSGKIAELYKQGYGATINLCAEMPEGDTSYIAQAGLSGSSG